MIKLGGHKRINLRS